MSTSCSMSNALVPPNPHVRSTSKVNQKRLTSIRSPAAPSSSVRPVSFNTPPFVQLSMQPINAPMCLPPTTQATSPSQISPPPSNTLATAHTPSQVNPNPTNTLLSVDPQHFSSPHVYTSPSDTLISSFPNATPSSPPSDVSHSVSPPSRHPMVTRSKNHISKPTLLPNGTPKYPLPHALTVSIDCPDVEPTCYSLAIKHAIWRDAMVDEFNALLKNGTWNLVSPSPLPLP